MKNTKKIIFALVLIALAVCLILWKLNVFNLPLAFAGVSSWGLIISAIMAVIIIHCILEGNISGIFIPLAVIAYVFDKPLGITAITPWIVLIAAVLLTIAVDMIFPKHRIHFRHRRNRDEFRGGRFTSESSGDDESGHISHSIRFGSATKYVRNTRLVSADLSSQFGELSVFFDGAEVADGNVSINCQVSFGEMDLYIPKEWHIDNRVAVTLGNCDDRSTNVSSDVETVNCLLDGSVAFGELKLIRI